MWGSERNQHKPEVQNVSLGRILARFSVHLHTLTKCIESWIIPKLKIEKERALLLNNYSEGMIFEKDWIRERF